MLRARPLEGNVVVVARRGRVVARRRARGVGATACFLERPDVEAVEEEVPETPDDDEEMEPADEEVESVQDQVQPTPVVSDGEKTSSSSDDVILCPACQQKLKVPYDRRPVRARCPACKCEFRALKG